MQAGAVPRLRVADCDAPDATGELRTRDLDLAAYFGCNGHQPVRARRTARSDGSRQEFEFTFRMTAAEYDALVLAWPASLEFKHSSWRRELRKLTFRVKA